MTMTTRERLFDIAVEIEEITKQGTLNCGRYGKNQCFNSGKCKTSD